MVSAGDDVKLLLCRQKALSPRTYRIGAGYTLFLGGLARVDLVSVPAATIYATVWASDLLPLHVGKTEKADEIYERFVGTKLYPPTDVETFASQGGGSGDVPELQPLRVCPHVWVCTEVLIGCRRSLCAESMLMQLCQVNVGRTVDTLYRRTGNYSHRSSFSNACGAL